MSIRYIAVRGLLLVSLLTLGVLLPAFPASTHEQTSEQDRVVGSVRSTGSSLAAPGATRGNGVLPSEKYLINADPLAAAVTLEILDPKAIESTDPNQIGVIRPLGNQTDSPGLQFSNPDGTSIRLLAFRSPDAVSLRIHFENFDLSADDEVYVYGMSADSYIAGPYKVKGPFSDREFWSDTIEGDTAIVEHYSKNGGSVFAVSEIIHNYRGLAGDDVITSVLSCHNDASCFSDPEKSAVGRITFIDGGSFVCTGTLMNNLAGDFALYKS